jgi:large subunit ribosomal protein L23
MSTPSQIVLKPIVTEKAAWEGQERNRYAFQVAFGVNKQQIKDAVQQLYKVRVVNVATQTHPGKSRRTKYGITPAQTWKRAIVALHPEDKIELF